MDIAFRPVKQKDLALLKAWIAQPHWQEWWGDPDHETSKIRRKVEGRDTTRPFIFQVDGRDAGFIQYWFVADQLVEPWLTETPWLTMLPNKAVGVDMSIADPAMLSRGIGTVILKEFLARLQREGFEDIIIDPDRENKRAIRAYEKAGFAEIPELTGKTGPYLIMRHQTE